MNSIKLHRFTELGNHVFVQAVRNAEVRKDAQGATKLNRRLDLGIQNMLLDESYVELVDDTIEIDIDVINEGFENQLDFAAYLTQQLGGIERVKTMLEDKNLMNWLSLLCLNVITAKNDNFYAIGEQTRYIVDFNYHSRHLIRTPLFMYCYIAEYFDYALLNTSTTQLSDLIKQFLNHDNIRSFPAALQLGNSVFKHMRENNYSSHDIREMGSSLTHTISSYLYNYDLWGCTEEELAVTLYNDDNLKPILNEVYPYLENHIDMITIKNVDEMEMEVV